MRSASRNGRIDVLEVLLEYGGNVNEAIEKEDTGGPSGTLLHVAASMGEDIVRWPVADGADVTVKDSAGVESEGDARKERFLDLNKSS